MKYEGSGSKGTQVIERKRSVTDGQTDRRTDGQGKNNMSPPEGGRHKYTKHSFINKCAHFLFWLQCSTSISS